MANENVSTSVDERSGTIAIHVNGNKVVLGFMNSGDRVPLRMDHGEVVPAAYADLYAVMKDGRAVGVLSRKQVLEGIAIAFTDGRIGWRMPD